MSTANTPLCIAPLFDLKSPSDPPFLKQLFCIFWVLDHPSCFVTSIGAPFSFTKNNRNSLGMLGKGFGGGIFLTLREASN